MLILHICVGLPQGKHGEVPWLCEVRPEGDQGNVTEIPEIGCVTIPGSGPNLDQQLVQ
jgi:hypothetical protein